MFAMSLLKLPDYLWGIETFYGCNAELLFDRFQTTYEELKPTKSLTTTARSSFQTTYEELKLSMGATPSCSSTASRLPMRNWNNRKVATVLESNQASRLPMRNWNRPMKPWFHIVSCRFQTTYEELKPISRKTSGKGWASRLPMRNWNLGLTIPEEICPWSFQTTYEELKRFTVDGIFDEYKVKLPDYLWGIETLRWDDGLGDLPASRLPMRNWNSSTLRYKSSGRFCFQTTYEELKPWIGCFFLMFSSCFQTTYEELKLASGFFFLKKLPTLPDYLWGIETEYIQHTGLSRVALPDYLWGIETSLRYRPHHQTALPDYLWGIETQRDKGSFWRHIAGFQTTYEELKHEICSSRTWTSNGFQTTYEELKLHNWPLCVTIAPTASRLPMRNWN